MFFFYIDGVAVDCHGLILSHTELAYPEPLRPICAHVYQSCSTDIKGVYLHIVTYFDVGKEGTFAGVRVAVGAIPISTQLE